VIKNTKTAYNKVCRDTEKTLSKMVDIKAKCGIIFMLDRASGENQKTHILLS
jgi:hypothetical protein